MKLATIDLVGLMAAETLLSSAMVEPIEGAILPNRTIIDVSDRQRLILLDSITQIVPDDAGSIVITGSHGGISVVEYATRYPLAAIFFNDAGVGKDEAGICAIRILEGKHIPAATYSHMSARIGDALDAWDNGMISHCNSIATARGIMNLQLLRQSVHILSQSSLACHVSEHLKHRSPQQ